MHITVDTDKCCGAGSCVLAAPELFDQDEDTGLVILLAEQPGDDQAAAARAAAIACPAGAITLADG